MYFLEWETYSSVLNLVPKTLEIKFSGSEILRVSFLFFISFAKKTNKQTNRKNIGRLGTLQQLWPITVGPDTNNNNNNNNTLFHPIIYKKSKFITIVQTMIGAQEILKNTAIKEKLQLHIYNKLLDKTRNEHYYILNR